MDNTHLGWVEMSLNGSIKEQKYNFENVCVRVYSLCQGIIHTSTGLACMYVSLHTCLPQYVGTGIFFILNKLQ